LWWGDEDTVVGCGLDEVEFVHCVFECRGPDVGGLFEAVKCFEKFEDVVASEGIDESRR
jgi:hypothetical protein